jgi:2-phospho-L-lactate/phosphoenolpyruvate guanylyltransferase
MWVTIPVKPFAYAKQRLSTVLSPEEREGLARTMLADLLSTLRQCPSVSGVLIVSQESAAHALAARYGASILAEEVRGLSRAVAQGGQHLAGLGEHNMLMLPGDVPLATSEEIEAVIHAHNNQSSPRLTIVADREGYGTNALALSPPSLMQFQFGHRSFQAHCAAAAELGATVCQLNLPGLAFDIDTPNDLLDLMTYDTDAETLAYLCDCGVAARLMPKQSLHAAW